MADPNVNVPAEIYANIRNKALEEAAKAAEKQARWIGYNVHAEAIAKAIRALKTKEPE